MFIFQLAQSSISHTTKPIAQKIFHKPPKQSISSSQSESDNNHSHRQKTKQLFTKIAVANATPLTAAAVVPASSKIPENTKQRLPNDKCKYCDKTFVKSKAMAAHLIERCEKIPATLRRQLLQDEKYRDEAKNKQVCRRKSIAYNQENDSISEYSRFFVNLRNDVHCIDGVDGLKNLRAEIRKTNIGHIGVSRTPSKLIRCHICQKIFFDCVDYAEHSTTHFLP